MRKDYILIYIIAFITGFVVGYYESDIVRDLGRIQIIIIKENRYVLPERAPRYRSPESPLDKETEPRTGREYHFPHLFQGVLLRPILNQSNYKNHP